MIPKIQHWLTSPTFQGDEEKTIRARLLHITLLSVIGFLVFVIAGNWLGGRTPTAVTGTDIFIIVVCLLFYYWMRQGRVRLVSVGLVTLGIVVIPLAIANLGTIRTPTTATYLTLVIVTGLLFDLRGIIVMTILSSLAILGLIAAENTGLLPPPDLSVTVTQWITYTALFGSSGGLTIMVLRSTRAALWRAESEIAKRALAEQVLRKSELKFGNIVEQSSDGIVLADERGTIIEWNRGQEQITGIERTEALGRPVWDVLCQTLVEEQKTPNTFEHLKASTLEFLRTGQAPWLNQLRETESQRPDGTRRSVQALMFPIKTDKGFMSVSIARDITQRKRAEELLRESEARFRSLFENSVMGISQALPDGRLVCANTAYAKMYGYADPEEMLASVSHVGQQLYANPQDREEALHILEEKGVMEPRELAVVHRDGTRFIVLVGARKITDSEGNLQCYQAEHMDITNLKRAEKALHEIEQRYRSLFENMLNGFAYCKMLFDDQDRPVDFVYLDVNRAFEQLTGLKHVVGKPVTEVIPGINEVSSELFERYARVALTGTPESFEIDFKPLAQWLSISVYSTAKGYFVALFENITERKRAEQERGRLVRELRISREQLQTLARHLVEVQEIERRFIARELHDEVGQVLTGLKLLLETSSQLPADTLRSRLSDAQSLVEQLMEQVQSMSLDLRPTMLDDLGLLPALLWLTKRFANQTGVRVLLEHAALFPRFAPEIETAAYRITQEALTNVARHADVKEAIVRLWATQDTLHVQVEDRGKGFHVQAALAVPTSSGLSGMRERAISLGGNLMIESTPGVGTLVTLHVPLSGPLERRMKERRE